MLEGAIDFLTFLTGDVYDIYYGKFKFILLFAHDGKYNFNYEI